MRLVNKTGYLKGAKTAKNPVNIIPSNLITTQGMAFPIKANGKTLYPNTGQYKFPTSYVVETPLKQKGTKSTKAQPKPSWFNTPIEFGKEPGSVGRYIGKALTLGAEPPKGRGYSITPSETAKQTAIDYATGEIGGTAFKVVSPYIKKAYKSSILKPTVDFIADKTSQKLGPLRDHWRGIEQGIYDIKKGRPIFETFPVTAKQKAYMNKLQEEAVKKGEDFSKRWYYNENNNLRPEVREKLASIMPETLAGKSENFNFLSNNPNNPIFNNPSVQLISSRRGQINLKNLSPIEKEFYEKSIQARRGKILGLNTPSNENFIIRNQGFYARKPKAIENTVIHEYGGHSGQKLGITKNVKNSLGVEEPITKEWGDQISKNVNGSALPNPNSKIGKQSEQVLSNEYWYNSPLELHAELMPVRKNLYDDMIKNGMSSEEALSKLHNPSDEILEKMVTSLSKHFKPGASENIKKEIIKALPAVGGIGMAGAAAQEKKNGAKLIKYKNGSKSVSLAFSRGEKDPKGGLTQKGVDKYNRATGGNLKMAVTTPPSKLKPGSKAANRRKSFCARMSGVKGPMEKNGKPTRKALALRKWNC
jgi:hypothetical protein